MVTEELARLRRELAPAGAGDLWVAPEELVVLEDAGPPVRATVEFRDAAEFLVRPDDVPTWTEDTNGTVISLDVAADGMSARIVPHTVGRSNVMVTTVDDDGSIVQVTDLVEVVPGKPDHGALHWAALGTASMEFGPMLQPDPVRSVVLLDEESSAQRLTTGAQIDSPLTGARSPRSLLGRLKAHRLLLSLLGVFVLVVAGVSYVFTSYALRSQPGARSLNSAVGAFRGGRDSRDGNLRYEPPVQGVYELKGEGTERISFPPNSQKDGAIMPASVTYLSNGCWRWHLDYNVAHWEEYIFCPRGNELFQTGNSNYQSWDFGTLSVTNVAHFVCPSTTAVLPAALFGGEVLRWTCSGNNTSISGTTLAKVVTRVIGTVPLSVHRNTVMAVHEVQVSTLSGPQKGTVKENWWFSAMNGLPLHMTRQITILTASPLGTITYTESGSWQMVSLRPRN